MDQEIYDLAIVGAGVAGLTSALYALRARRTVLILEQNAIGGQILPAIKISNYPGLPDVSGQAFVEALKSQVKALGGVFALERVEKVEKLEKMSSVSASSSDSLPVSSLSPLFQITTDETSSASPYLARTLILATGSAERKLNLPGERELTGHGLSYCATCDGALYSGKTVGVYGGGASAVSSALYLSNLAETVYLIHRSNRFRADTRLLELLDSTPNLKLLHNSEIVRLKSTPEPNRSLSAVIIKNTREPDRELTTLPLSALFINIGRVPDNKPFADLVDLDPDGYIVSDETCTTRTPGVFCAGDTRKKPLNQLVTATSDGAVSASAAVAYLRENFA